MIWEYPIASMWYEFVIRPQEEPKIGDAFYHSQSAKSVNREKKAKKSSATASSSIQDILEAKKRQLSGEDFDPEENLNYTINKSVRRNSNETEDLEASSDSHDENQSPSPSNNNSSSKKKMYSFKTK